MKPEEFHNAKQLKELKWWLLNRDTLPYKAFLLVGPPGVGKTSGTYAVAEDMGLDVVEFNLSDYRTSESMERLKYLVKTSFIRPTLILLDEVDGADPNKILKIIEDTTNPIVMTANDYSVQKHYNRSWIRVLKFYKPRLASVVKRARELAKKQGVKANFTGIRPDWRQVETVGLGGEGYENRSRETELLSLLAGEKSAEKPPTRSEEYLLAESILQQTLGYYTWRAVKYLCAYDLLKEPDVLSATRERLSEINQSSYLEKLKGLRSRRSNHI